MEQPESTSPTAPASSPANPYAPPSASVGAPVYASGPEAPLASPWSRLGAQMLNGVVMLPAMICYAIAAGTMDQETQSFSTLGMILIGVAVAYAIGVMVVNLKLLAREGQSLGKKWAKVRVVRRDGSRASLGRLVGLRYMVNGMISGIPLVGSLYALVDSLFVFRSDRRTIHDMMADTKVVEAR